MAGFTTELLEMMKDRELFLIMSVSFATVVLKLL